MEEPTTEELEIFEKHKKERFGKFHSYKCDRFGYCHCEVCEKVKRYLNIGYIGE